MYTLTSMELWGMVLSAFVAAGASYLAGKWHAEVALRNAINTRKEVASLPGWQPVMMELHVSGYNYWEIGGKLNLDGKFVLRELTSAYSTLHSRERARASYPNRYRARIRFFNRLVRVMS